MIKNEYTVNLTIEPPWLQCKSKNLRDEQFRDNIKIYISVNDM